MIFVDGIASPTLPADDRGLQYGDGLFETIALVDQQPQHFERHLARMARGAARLGIACPDAAQWHADLAHALAAAPRVDKRVLKLMLTRGSGGRGYAPPPHARPRRLVQLADWPAWRHDLIDVGIRVTCCATPLGRNPCLAGIKHLNRLEQVLGAGEVATAGCEEGLMFDDRDRLVEGTRTNVFVLVDDEWLTPPVDEAGVAGILRELILELAPAAGIAVRESPLPRPLLARVDEMFVCNSLAGVWPVREIIGTVARVFGGFDATRRLHALLASHGALP